MLLWYTIQGAFSVISILERLANNCSIRWDSCKKKMSCLRLNWRKTPGINMFVYMLRIGPAEKNQNNSSGTLLWNTEGLEKRDTQCIISGYYDPVVFWRITSIVCCLVNIGMSLNHVGLGNNWTYLWLVWKCEYMSSKPSSPADR